jgi:hypothetical protein
MNQNRQIVVAILDHHREHQHPMAVPRHHVASPVSVMAIFAKSHWVRPSQEKWRSAASTANRRKQPAEVGLETSTEQRTFRFPCSVSQRRPGGRRHQVLFAGAQTFLCVIAQTKPNSRWHSEHYFRAAALSCGTRTETQPTFSLLSKRRCQAKHFPVANKVQNYEFPEESLSRKLYKLQRRH